MTHWRCGGTITLEMASLKWKATTAGSRYGSRPVLQPTSQEAEIGRCDKCGLAGIVCEPPR